MSDLDFAKTIANLSDFSKKKKTASTNLHVISGEVVESSENGSVEVAIDGLVFSENDSQSIPIDTLGGLREGDIATILLAGEEGRGMTPLAIGGVGTIDRIEAEYAKIDYLDANFAHITEGVIDNATIDQAKVNNLSANYAHISNGEIDNANIDQANVNNLSANYAHIVNGVIDNAEIHGTNIVDGTITGAQIASSTITGSNLVNGTITATQIANSTITGSKIKNGTIEAADIKDGTITGTKISDATITGSKIQNGTITNANIEDGTITGTKIQGSTLTDIPYAEIDELKAANVTSSQIAAATGYIGDLTTGNITAANIIADHGTVGNLAADHVTVQDFTAATGRIGALEADHVTVAEFQAEQGFIDTLQANTADIANIRANAAKVKNLTAAELEADHATISQLDTNFAHADMANVSNAWIENGTVKDGAITNAMIGSLSANKLTAGTINGSEINVTNLNADNITAGTINGQRIGEGSLSLSKLEEDVYTEDEVDAKLRTMQSQIDGAIETWTGTAVPTLNNAPASSWTTTALKDAHVGDVYFVVNSQSQQNGYNYRFTKTGSTYSWQLIKDNDVTTALQRITEAEGKITTFDSDISQLKTDTGSLTTRTTTLETSMGDKVDVTEFNELSDTVEGHTQSITKLTNSSTTLANPNLSPFFSWPLDDRYVASTNPDGYWANIASYENNWIEYLSDGWIHAERENTSDEIVYITIYASSVWQQNNTPLKNDTVYTVLGEIRNRTSENTDSYLTLVSSSTTNAIGMFASAIGGNNSSGKLANIEKELRGTTTTRSSFSNSTTVSRTLISIAPGESVSLDFRLSIYEGVYDGPYKPYVGPSQAVDIRKTAVQVSSIEHTVDGIGTRVGSLETTITTKADNSTVETVSNNLSTLQQDVNGFKTTVSSTYATKESVDNLQIGGRNLFKGSGTTTLNGWTKESATVSDGVATITKAASGNSRIYQMPANGYWSWEAGQTYTVSVDVKGSSEGCMLQFNPVSTGAATKAVSISTEWARYSYTFTVTKDSTGSMSFFNHGATGDVIQLRYPKLEHGSKATDWTPAPEDMATGSALTSVTERVTQAESTIEQHTNSIALKANSSDVYTKTESNGLISTEVTNRNAAIEAATNAITLSVKETYSTKTDASQMAQPNLAPLFSMDHNSVYNATTNPNGYWRLKLTGNGFTQLDDGWTHFEYDNTSGTDRKYSYIRPARVPSIVPGNPYTILLEIRNNAPTGTGIHDIYLQQIANNQFWGNVTDETIDADHVTTTTSVDLTSCGASFVRRSYRLADTEHLTDESGFLFTYTIRTTGGCTNSLDLRMSIYEGIYDGPYKPYSGSVLYATQSELKVTADGISSEVSKKVNGTEIISAINQSAETVKIQASKVEIDGTAVFTAISSKVDDAITDKGYQTSSQVEDAITGKGYATTTQAQGYASTAKSEAISAAAADATTKASTAETNAKKYTDDLEIGGRNLLAWSDRKGATGTSSSGLSWTHDADGWITVTGTISSSSAGLLMFWGTTDTSNYIYPAGTYTVTVENDGLLASQVLRFQIGYDGATYKYSYVSDSITFTAENGISRVCVYRYGANGTAVNGRIRFKMEKGTKATDWTPAPEDVAADISELTSNAVKRTQRIYYRSNSATAPSTPGTASSNWVTKADDGNAAWTKMHVAISSTHKYIYTCEQYEMANGTVGYTSVLLDNTITVIDGGNIITGSVKANSIDAASGTFNTANIPNLSAAKITSGTISADRIGANSITAAKIDASELHVSAANIDGTITFGQLSGVQAAGDYALSDDIPTNVSDLTNDTGFITSSSVPTKVSQLTNDSGFQNSTQVDTAITSKGYQTSDQVENAITAKGYQTSDQVESAITAKGYATSSALTTEVNQRKAQYGTCSTAAGTAAKVVTCANFELVAGNELTVKFTVANTSAAKIQLNVNSKGAKDVWVANAVTAAANQLLWGANAYITFRYDGEQFVVIGEPRTWYGASTTAASTAAKTDTTVATGAVICKGAKVELAMTNQNTAASPTLNIAGTGAKALYFGTGTARPTQANGTSWLATNTATFTFDGQYWRTAGKTYIDANSIVTGYISADRIEAGSLTIGKVDGLETTLNGKANSGDIPTKVSDLENDSEFITDDDIQIGGRNFLRDTQYMTSWGKNNGTTIVDGVVTFPTVTANTWREIYPGQNFKYDLIRNKKVTFSCEANVPSGQTSVLNFCIGLDTTETANARQKYRNQSVTITGTGTWQKVSVTADISDAWFTSGSGTVDYDNCWVTVRPGAWSSSWASFQVRLFKLELGNKATDWTPAPEDVDADISTKLDASYNRIWYAECSTVAATTAKVATITPTTTSFSLVKGQTVNVLFTATNTGAVGDLTLSVNGTTAKGIRYLNNGALANLPNANYLRINQIVTFTYDGSYWVADFSYYDSGGITNARYRTQNPNAIKAATAIDSAHIICGTSAGYKNIAANVEFNLDYPLLYATAAIAAAATGTSNYLTYNGINVANNGTVQGVATNKMVYLKGTVTGNTFKIAASNFLTCTVPSSADGFVYIPLGIAYNTTPNIYFSSNKDLYAYVDGAFGPVSIREASAAAKTATNYLTDISSSGLMVHRSTDANTGVKITNNVDILKSGVSVAQYGEETRIGRIDQTHTLIGSGTFRFSGYGVDMLSMSASNPDSWVSHAGANYAWERTAPATGTWTIDISECLSNQGRNQYLYRVADDDTLVEGVDYSIDYINKKLYVREGISGVSVEFLGRSTPATMDVDFYVYDGLGTDADNALIRASSSYDAESDVVDQTIFIGRNDSARLGLHGGLTSRIASLDADYIYIDGMTSVEVRDPSSTSTAYLQLGKPTSLYSTGSVSVANSSWVSVANLTIPSTGTWLVVISGDFAANATGRRILSCARGTPPTAAPGYDSQNSLAMAPANGANTKFSSSAIIDFDAGDVYYASVWQNSGSALQTRIMIKAVRLI